MNQPIEPSKPDSSKIQNQKVQDAIELIKKGKLSEAESIYRKLIQANTRNHFVYANLAAICGMQNRLDELIELLNKALELEGNFPEAYFSIGGALLAKGELNAAIKSYKKAIQLKPNNPDAYIHLGNALLEKNDTAAAISAYEQAIKLSPNQLDAYCNMGAALQKQGDSKTAIEYYKKVLNSMPNHFEANNNLCSALQEQGDFKTAKYFCDKALMINPNHAGAYNNLGLILQQQGDLEAAIKNHTKALSIDPKHSDACVNLGNALQEEGRLNDAITSYRRAIQINPSHKDALTNLAIVELLTGDYKNGLKRYENRLRGHKSVNQLYTKPSHRKWEGEEATHGKDLLLIGEQGLGDILQFVRYIIPLKQQGFNISLCIDRKLHSLIRASCIETRLVSADEASQFSKGKWSPLLSVPRHLDVSPKNAIINHPYIHTTDELDARWKAILRKENRPIIGINWQGNPQTEKTSLRGRSMPLETFAPITRSHQALLLSLQKGFGSEQLENCSFRRKFVDCQNQVNDTWDFLETAAIVKNCDLIITSDSAVAHLAGSMGKPTWLLLKKIPDWRWGTEGSITFWYPTMRLFRQRERGDWNEVMNRVDNELSKLLRTTESNISFT